MRGDLVPAELRQFQGIASCQDIAKVGVDLDFVFVQDSGLVAYASLDTPLMFDENTIQHLVRNLKLWSSEKLIAICTVILMQTWQYGVNRLYVLLFFVRYPLRSFSPTGCAYLTVRTLISSSLESLTGHRIRFHRKNTHTLEGVTVLPRVILVVCGCFLMRFFFLRGSSEENEHHICVSVCCVEGRGKSLSRQFFFVCEKHDWEELVGGMTWPKDEMGSQIVPSESDLSPRCSSDTCLSKFHFYLFI